MQTIAADWACPTQISSPSSDPENGILTSVFRLVSVHGLLRCERVCKGWHDVLRQPIHPGMWATQLDLIGRPGARRPWRVFVREPDSLPWSSESFRKKADYDEVLAWLRPRIAGFSSLSLVLDGDTWYLLSEVLTMSLHLLRPHFELKLPSGNLSGHFSHKVNAAAQSTASEQSCLTSSSTMFVVTL